MKTLLKTTMLLLLLAVSLSCKKNMDSTGEINNSESDSTSTTIDTVGPNSDSTQANGAGTTGATGEGSTGSGSAGTEQKGNTNVKTDSTSTNKGRK